jgi:hypothetical protein
VPEQLATARQAGTELAGKDLATGERGSIPENVTPVLRQAARNLGITEENLKESLPTGTKEVTRPSTWLRGQGKTLSESPVQKGMQARFRILDEATAIQERQFHQLLDPYKGLQAPMYDVVGKLRSTVTAAERTVAPSMADEVDRIATRLAGPKTLGEADALRVELNKSAERIYSQAREGGSPASDLKTADAYRRAADSIRDGIYSKLENVTNIPKERIQAVQRLHGDVIRFRDAAMQKSLGVQPEELELRQRGRVATALTGRTGQAPVYKARIVERLIGRTPQAEQNALMRGTLKNLGEGGESPKFPAKALPPASRQLPGAPFQFTISGDLPVEVIEGRGTAPEPGSSGVASTKGPGTMYTTDVKVAEQTLKNLNEAYVNAKDAATKARVKVEAMSLMDQLDQYRESQVPPRTEVPGKPATRGRALPAPLNPAAAVGAIAPRRNPSDEWSDPAQLQQ